MIGLWFLLIGSPICTLSWSQNQRPCMTLNGHTACYCTNDAFLGVHHGNLNIVCCFQWRCHYHHVSSVVRQLQECIGILPHLKAFQLLAIFSKSGQLMAVFARKWLDDTVENVCEIFKLLSSTFRRSWQHQQNVKRLTELDPYYQQLHPTILSWVGMICPGPLGNGHMHHRGEMVYSATWWDLCLILPVNWLRES